MGRWGLWSGYDFSYSLEDYEALLPWNCSLTNAS